VNRLEGVPNEPVPGFAEFGVSAFTTTRDAGSFNLSSDEPAADVFGRWSRLLDALGQRVPRLASAHQVHGDRILVHGDAWSGWLRDQAGADGHLSRRDGTAMAVSLADCVPVYMAHPTGACAVLHSGWRGTASRIIEKGIDAFERLELPASELHIHLGPSICGRCYEVGPEVHAALTGESVAGPAPIDLRAIMARQAEARGAMVSVSDWCTRCHNERFFSHRAGDSGRQLGVIVAMR
jgi:YfiH family protein